LHQDGLFFEDVSERQIDPLVFVSTFFTDAMQSEFLRGVGHDEPRRLNQL